MIVFEPNTETPMELTREQLYAVVNLVRNGESARVVERDTPLYVEVYVGPHGHEPIRHAIHEDGREIRTEYDPNDNGDWR